MNQPETRHSLIAHLKGDDNERAWVEFVTLYEPFLQHLVIRLGVPQRHVADVVQQVLLAIAKSVDGWKDDGQPVSFRRWLATVARNIVIKFMQQERRQVGGRGGTDFVDLLEQIPATPDREQVARYEHELIVWAAEQVRHEFIDTSWAAFWATVIDGQPVKDVAYQLGITCGSIYMSRSRIMARIRRKVDEVLDDAVVAEDQQ
ncbi:MAG TPA: sigma-70 family RNA polymerase sigma factor [Planctomycetaceae bacterium]|nr:sigma-70 family RNA polymerase sigma factor [Planctomycetaceae bacterium]